MAAGRIRGPRCRDRPGPVPDFTGVLPAGTRRTCLVRLLFLDTETTGLAGGTGTVPFLVGLAWWDGRRLLQVQAALPAGPGPRRTPPRDDADLASRFRVVATYNGAAFDLPLLRTRARLNRRPDPTADLVGWDLLVAARRSWGRRLDDCRQQTIEQEVCGRRRGPGDIAGALIPATYQSFVQAGELGDLPAVLRHNRRDMDGLALVLEAAGRPGCAVDHGEPGAWPAPWPRRLEPAR